MWKLAWRNGLKCLKGGKCAPSWAVENNLDVEISVEEWFEMSKRGEVCAILGCRKQPVVSCLHCGGSYCEEHRFTLEGPGHSGGILEIPGKAKKVAVKHLGLITDEIIDGWEKRYNRINGQHYCQKCGSLIKQVTCYVSIHLKLFEPTCAGTGKVRKINYPFCPKCEGDIEYVTACYHVSLCQEERGIVT